MKTSRRTRYGRLPVAPGWTRGRTQPPAAWRTRQDAGSAPTRIRRSRAHPGDSLCSHIVQAAQSRRAHSDSAASRRARRRARLPRHSAADDVPDPGRHRSRQTFAPSTATGPAPGRFPAAMSDNRVVGPPGRGPCRTPFRPVGSIAFVNTFSVTTIPSTVAATRSTRSWSFAPQRSGSRTAIGSSELPRKSPLGSAAGPELVDLDRFHGPWWNRVAPRAARRTGN